MKASARLILGGTAAAVLVLSVTVYFHFQKEAEERERGERAKRDAAAWREGNQKDTETYRIDNKPASFKGFPGVN